MGNKHDQNFREKGAYDEETGKIIIITQYKNITLALKRNSFEFIYVIGKGGFGKVNTYNN